MPKENLFFLALFVCCNFITAQNTISGKIYSNSSVLPGAHIHIGRNTATSDNSGFYSIGNLPSGPVKLHASFLGYTALDTIIELQGSLNLDLRLTSYRSDLKEVVVRQKSNAISQSAGEQRLRTETIEKYSNQTLGDALKEIPGVASLKAGSAVVKPVINGLYGSRVPIINNNVRLEDQQWGSEHAPNFDVNSAAKITVIKGASGLQYGGDAVGGLVVIEPLSAAKDTLFGRTILNYDTNGKGGSVSSSIHKGNTSGFSWNALGTFKYMGDKQAPDYILSNTGNREANFSGDLKYTAQKYDIGAFYSYYNAVIGILSASHTGNVNDLYNSINNKVPAVVKDFTYTINNPKQEVQHHIAKLNFNYYFDETQSLALQYAFQLNNRLEYDIRRGDYNNLAALDLELTTHTFNADYKKKLHDWNIKTGLSAGLQNNYADPKTGIRPLIPNYDKADFGIYTVANHNISDSFILDGGLRYDFSKIDATKFYLKSRWEERGYDEKFHDFIVGDYATQWLTKPSFTFHNLSASAGFHKAFEDNWDWYTNLSLASRNPNPSEFFSDGLHHSTGVIELGDLSLKKEQALKLSLTVHKKFSRFSIDINPYFSSIKDYMFLKPVGFETTIRGAFPVWEYQQTNARLMGLDMQSIWDISSHWQHLFALSYVHGEDITGNEPLIDMPPLNFNNKIRYSNRSWHGLLLELKNEVVLRQRRYPNNNFTTNIIVDDAFVPVLVDISTPPPGYSLLHFYSEMKFPAFKKATATIALSVQNIFDTKYRDYLNRQRFFADEIGRSIQIQLKFNY